MLLILFNAATWHDKKVGSGTTDDVMTFVPPLFRQPFLTRSVFESQSSTEDTPNHIPVTNNWPPTSFEIPLQRQAFGYTIRGILSEKEKRRYQHHYINCERQQGTKRMSSFVLGEDAEAEDQLAAFMAATDTVADLNRPSTDTNDAEKEAEAALDSILETSVAEVNLALSHDDAVAAAVNAAALDATNASSVVVDEAAVTAAAAVAAADAVDVMKEAIEAQGSIPSETQLSEANTVVAAIAANGNNGTMNTAKAAPQPPVRAGRWSLDEKILFLFGLQKFGKGHWKKISMYVPDR